MEEMLAGTWGDLRAEVYGYVTLMVVCDPEERTSETVQFCNFWRVWSKDGLVSGGGHSDPSQLSVKSRLLPSYDTVTVLVIPRLVTRLTYVDRPWSAEYAIIDLTEGKSKILPNAFTGGADLGGGPIRVKKVTVVLEWE